MGKSAKACKRFPSKKSTPTHLQVCSQVQAAKRASLKTNGKNSQKQKSGGVLGGADYVTLMMGGRRKANEEAKKLPQDDS